MSTRSGAPTTARRPTLVRNAASRSVYRGSCRRSCMPLSDLRSAARCSDTPRRGICRGSGRREGGEHVVGVRVGLDVVHDLRDPPVGRDEEGRSLHAPVGLPHVALLAPRAVALGDLVLRIAPGVARVWGLAACGGGSGVKGGFPFSLSFGCPASLAGAPPRPRARARSTAAYASRPPQGGAVQRGLTMRRAHRGTSRTC